MTDAERKLWQHMRNNQLGVKIRRQIPIGPYILDFFCQKALLCIEVDGSQHYEEKGMTHDEKRDSYLKEVGIDVLRVTNRDVLKNTQGVLRTIYDMIYDRINTETPSFVLPSTSRVVDLRGEGNASHKSVTTQPPTT